MMTINLAQPRATPQRRPGLSRMLHIAHRQACRSCSRQYHQARSLWRASGVAAARNWNQVQRRHLPGLGSNCQCRRHIHRMFFPESAGKACMGETGFGW